MRKGHEAIDTLNELAQQKVESREEELRAAIIAQEEAEKEVAEANQVVENHKKETFEMEQRELSRAITSPAELERFAIHRRERKELLEELILIAKEAMEKAAQAEEKAEAAREALAFARAEKKAVEKRLEARAKEINRLDELKAEDEADERAMRR